MEQALAAVGQIKLMALYERTFAKFDISVAQVLLTAADLANRQRYINAKHTFQMLLGSSIIPIVNENDTVAVEEMKFGDNDHLSALVATLLEADLLVILSGEALSLSHWTPSRRQRKTSRHEAFMNSAKAIT